MIVGALAVVIIVLATALLWPKQSVAPIAQITTDTDLGIQISMPHEQDVVSSPLTISGIVTGNGWAGYEGQVGTVVLYDTGDNQLASGVLTTTTEWTSLPIHFEAVLNFKEPIGGIGGLVFYNENPSGDPANDKTFTWSIRSKNTPSAVLDK